jgi:hypothetical protein
MDMSISKKRSINQLEPFEKPCFVIVGVDFVVICGTLGLLLVSMFEENKGYLHLRPLNLSTPSSPLPHVVLKFHVLSKNATTFQSHSLCML